MKIINTIDRNGNNLFDILFTEYSVAFPPEKIGHDIGIKENISIYYDAKTEMFLLTGQLPGFLNTEYTREEFHCIVNQLVYWLLKIDQTYLSP